MVLLAKERTERKQQYSKLYIYLYINYTRI